MINDAAHMTELQRSEYLPTYLPAYLVYLADCLRVHQLRPVGRGDLPCLVTVRRSAD